MIELEGKLTPEITLGLVSWKSLATVEFTIPTSIVR